MDVPVYNMEGRVVGTLAIDEATLGGKVNPALIKQAYVRYHANRRLGTSRTLSRGEVEGSTRKLYRQKGTGRARHGDRRPNIFRGGGHAFAKRRTREHYRLDMPRKMRRQANRNALLAKLIDQEVKVLEDLTFERPRTADCARLLRALGVDRSALLAVSPDPDRSRNVRLACRNLPEVSTCRATDLNCFEMLNRRYLIITREDLVAWLEGPGSQTGKRAPVRAAAAAGGGT